MKKVIPDEKKLARELKEMEQDLKLREGAKQMDYNQIIYYEESNIPENETYELFETLDGLVENLKAIHPCTICQTLTDREGNCEDCLLENFFDQQSDEFDAWMRLKNLLDSPYIVCMCRESGHKDSCLYGKRGKDIFKKVVCYLKNNPLTLFWVADKLGLM